jgi:hypothetical protein
MVFSEEKPICGVCGEPVYHPICIDCLGERIREWIKENSPFLVPEFDRIHGWLDYNFRKRSEDEEWNTCILCKKVTKLTLCPHCYIRTIFHHIRQFYPRLADKLTEIFDYDFEHAGYFGDVEIEHISEDFYPYKFSGMCEECEQFSEDLEDINGRMMCNSCREDLKLEA